MKFEALVEYAVTYTITGVNSSSRVFIDGRSKNSVVQIAGIYISVEDEQVVSVDVLLTIESSVDVSSGSPSTCLPAPNAPT